MGGHGKEKGETDWVGVGGGADGSEKENDERM